MSLHTREKLFGFGATPKIPPIEAIQDKCGAARRLDANVSALEFPPPLTTLALGPSGLRSLASLGQSAHWALAPNTRGFGRREYCGIGRGGLFSKDSLPILESLCINLKT